MCWVGRVETNRDTLDTAILAVYKSEMRRGQCLSLGWAESAIHWSSWAWIEGDQGWTSQSSLILTTQIRTVR